METQVDPGPLNRSEMLEKFLYVLFSKVQRIPSYSTVPDLKDSLYVMGFYAETMIRTETYVIDKGEFLREANRYCSAKLVDIEADILFAVLVEAGILIRRHDKYVFRFSYWLYFFAAHRMHQDEEFFQFVMRGKKYSQFPEVIEFYSGIDRRRSDLLQILLEELGDVNKEFSSRSGIDDENKFFDGLTWEPKKEELEKVVSMIEGEVRGSHLPDVIKDAIADRNFSFSAPYYQQVNRFLNDSSFLVCTRVMRAAARALRNSNHADVEIRRRLLFEVMATWSRVMKVTAMLLPALAAKGSADYEGFGYVLDAGFMKFEGRERLNRMLSALPYNVSGLYQSDIYSPKMIPLFRDFLEGSSHDERRYLIASRIVAERGGNWFNVCVGFVNSLPKNSFFLSAIWKDLISAYDFGFANEADRGALRHLIGLVYGRHLSGPKGVNNAMINKAAAAVLDQRP